MGVAMNSWWVGLSPEKFYQAARENTFVDEELRKSVRAAERSTFKFGKIATLHDFDIAEVKDDDN